MNQEPKPTPLDHIKQAVTHLNCDFTARCVLIDAVRFIEGELTELAHHRKQADIAKKIESTENPQ